MKKKIFAVIMIILGIGAMLSAGGLWYSNMLEENSAAEYVQNVTQEIMDVIRFVDVDTVSDVQAEDVPDNVPLSVHETGMTTVEFDNVAYLGVLNIPSLNRTLAVNATWSYPALQNTPCRFSGSLLDDTLVLMAHNYRAHFRGISELALGEPIYLTDAQGAVHHYEVVAVTTVEPGRTIEVMHSDYDLTLFTCTTGGQARTIVRCMRVWVEHFE